MIFFLAKKYLKKIPSADFDVDIEKISAADEC